MNSKKSPTASSTMASSVRERASASRAKAKKVIRRRDHNEIADQPSAETLPAGSAVEQSAQPFPSENQSAQSPTEGLGDAQNRNDADGGNERLRETTMGRHESFENATPLTDELLSGTALNRHFDDGDKAEAAADAAERIQGDAFAEYTQSALKKEGERLLQIALAELGRRLDGVEGVSDDQERSHETRLRRELRIDALMVLSGRMDPSDKPLPEPGSEEAIAAFHAACGETDRLAYQAVHGYPELKHADGMTSWCKNSLTRAVERGEIAPAEYARLYLLAAEREHRVDAAVVASNIGPLFALAHADE